MDNDNTMAIRFPESSMIASLEFDPKANLLYARYQSGEAYQYFNITWNVIKVLAEADSVGKAFHAIVKKNEHLYPFKRIA